MGLLVQVSFVLIFLLSSIVPEVEAQSSSTSSLKFVLLGDWGKGGIYGDIQSKLEKVELSAVSAPRTLRHEGARKLKDEDDKEGDIDITYTYQVAVAKALGTWASANSPSFVIALGDNFYTNGVASTSDAMWDTHWKQVYLGYEKLNVPWMPVFGNHDYGYGNTGVQAQLDFAKVNALWQMIGKNYSQYYSIPDGGTVAIIYIDTTTLAPSVNKCCNSKGGVSDAVMAERISSQLKNIEKMLQQAVAKASSWIFIAGHYPVYSAGPNGDTSELQTYLKPLIEKYGVAAYFSGHDHISQHLQQNGVDYFISGAGCMTDGMGDGTAAGKVVWSGTGYSAFATVSLTSQAMTITYTNANGQSVYSYTKAKASGRPTPAPTRAPTVPPTFSPTSEPTFPHPSSSPSGAPTYPPTLSPTTVAEKLFYHIDKFSDHVVDQYMAEVAIVSASLMMLVVYGGYNTLCNSDAVKFEKLNEDSVRSSSSLGNDSEQSVRTDWTARSASSFVPKKQIELDNSQRW